MRLIEFTSKSLKSGNPSKVFSKANPGALTGIQIDKYYDVYRASLLMGKSPGDLSKLDPGSWINNQPYFGAYTDADENKIRAAFKAMNIKPRILVQPGSREHENIHHTSPVKPFKGYPR